MRKHITMRSGWAGALAFLILAVAAFGADTDWDLSTPADYRVEKGDGTEDTAAEEVTVTGGVAKTLKQTDALAQGSRAGYDAGAHDGTKSGPRPAVFLRLKRTGLNYPASGAFQSRVLDAGAGGYWDKIFARVHNAYSVGGGTGWTGAEAGLISLYRFDGDWTDTGPGAHHIVTFYGNISLGANRPVGSGAAVFAGANDYADLPLAWNAMFAGNSGTVAFWVRTTNTRNQMFLANTTDNDEYLYFTGGNLYFRQSDVQIAGRFVPEQGKWYHLAFVKDDAIGRIYVDGVLIAEGAMGAWGDQTIRLGAYYNGGNDVFGSMDELAFFDSVLTAADLRAMARQGAAVRFQVRSGPTTGLAGAFVGPDGTAGTYYLGDGENLMTAGNFDSAHRYAQYRAIFLNGSTDKRNTPSVDRVDLAAADGCVRDETFAGGTHESADSETVSFTDRDEASGFVGLAWDRGLGRYQTAGSYTSRVFDAGAAADWNSLAWTVANQGAETTEADLFALWRMDGDWVDAVGGATLVPSSHTTWDPGNARFGTHAAYFDGSDDVLDSPATNGTYRYYIGETGSIAFWVRYEQADGIRYLLGSPDANTTYLYTREDQALLYFCLNGQLNYAVWTPRADTWYYFVIVRENNGDGAVYINGDEVVRTNSGPMPVERIRFGARNDLAYDFQGWIDDVAFYQRPLSVIEIRDRYARALSPRFQCRSGATNPPASAFVGPDGTAGTYYTTATGHAFGVEIPDARFFQYRASFEAPQGVATPRLATATVTYNGGTTQTDAARADFDRGVYDDDATAWRADVVRLAELTYPAERTGAESGITQLWNFNDDYNNAVGIGAWDPKGDMIANGFSSTHYRFRGYALQFDGDDDYLESNLGWDDVFEPAGSLEFWVKPNDVSTSPFVLASPSNDAGYVYLASNNRLYWRIEGQNAYWTQVWEAGQWYHIVLTKDGNDAAAYVNGQLLGTYTFSNPASSEKIRVGMRYNNGNDFNGYIDGMAVYNRALTAGEVAEYYGGAAYPTTTKTFIGALDAGTQVEWKTFRYTEDIAHGRSVGTQTEEIPIDSSGLVYLWRCNDDWTDSKGNADGVAAGGVGFASGKVDAAGSFDGTDDFVAIQNLHYTTAGEIGNLSVSCWIKTDKTNTSIVDFDRSDYYSLGVDFHSGDPNRISWDTAGPTTGVHDMASVTTVTDNQWHHVVVTFEKATGTKRIYIDGALDNEVVGAHNANEGLGIGVEDRYGYLGDGSEAEFFTFLVAERNQRYYKGLLDDVGIWTRVLTAQEVKDLYSTGGVAAVWSMDDASWTTNVPSAVSSVGGYTGTPRGDAAQDADGRVGKAATFDGAGDWLEVPHHNNFNFGGNPFSIEFWAYPVLTDNDYHCVLAKQADTNTGIQVTLHRNQRPYIRLNNVTRNVGYFRRFEWNHIVFVYDGSNRGAVYVDGVYQGQQNWPAPTDNGSNLGIGGGGITYAHTFDGKLDEVAVYNRMLTHAEIVEHCKRGLTRMTVQLSDDGGATWTDEAGNVGQSVSRSPAALSGVGPCQALLYRVQLTSLDGTVTPSLRGVEASRSFFPTNNPRVLPLAGQAYPGYLTGFVETAGAGNQGEVTYQISHDNGATWSWWNGATWASTVQGYTQSNTAAVVHANIDSFYEVRGAGTLRWRAFLHAPDGRKVVELDNVRLSYSPGGVQVTAPNAGAAVFYVTGDHDITWTTTGAVSGNWDLAYSTDSGATWTPIAANQAIADADDGAADGAFTYTWTNVPAVAVSTQARIKVTDTGDAGIRDTSDNDFTIRYPGFDITAPDGGETMLLGAPHTITWTHAGPVSPTDCTIEYSANGAGGPWTVVANNVDGSADSYVGWTAPTTATTTARMRIKDERFPADSFAISDADFEVGGGFQVTRPDGGETFYVGETENLEWLAAQGMGAKVELLVSVDGATFPILVSNNIDNVMGSNTWAWSIGASTEDSAYYSETARVRIKRITPLTTSDDSDAIFTLAGLKVLYPNGGERLGVGANPNIQWKSAGAGATVTIQYRNAAVDPWTTITATAPNVAGVNTYNGWTVDALPSATAEVRIFSNTDVKLDDTSDATFTFANLKVTSPNGGEVWQAGRNVNLTWDSAGAGATVSIYYSVSGGAPGAWTLIDNNVANADGGNTYPWTVPFDPSSTVRVRVVSNSDATLTDDSDANVAFAGYRITAPNGGESVGIDAGTSITWRWANAGATGTVSYSLDGGTTWQTTFAGANILSSQGAAGLPWVPANEPGMRPTVRARVQIVADDPAADPNPAVPLTLPMDDASDTDFTLAGLQITAPTAGTTWTLGSAGNNITFIAAGSGVANATLYYSAAGDFSDQLAIGTPAINEVYPGNNSYAWTIPASYLPSATAKVKVVAGPYQAVSDAFTVKGMRLTRPAAGDVVTMDTVQAVDWRYAGVGDAVQIYYSNNGGASYGVTPLNGAPLAITAGTMNWTVDASATAPSATGRLKMQVVAGADVGQAVESDIFQLRGIRLTAPSADDTLALDGGSTAVTWIQSGAGTNLNLYYAPDGTTFDPTPINGGAPVAVGAGSYAWSLPARLTPANGTAKLKCITDSGLETTTDAFTMEGILVTEPAGGTGWSVSQNVILQWTAVGTGAGLAPAADKYDLYYVIGGVETKIDTGAQEVVTADNFPWTVPSEAVAANVRIRVRDRGTGAHVGDSEPFTISNSDTIAIVSPAPGDRVHVGQSATVRWTKIGTMTDRFRIEIDDNPDFTSPTVLVPDQVMAYNVGAGQYSHALPAVPDDIGARYLRITNSDAPAITNKLVAPFTVAPYLQIVSPNGGGSYYALREESLSFNVTGSIASVDLEYSLDGGVTWSGIGSATLTNTDGAAPNNHPWPMANAETTTARIRVRHPATGAVDASDNVFTIQYYTVTWNLKDGTTADHLELLSVNDNSGWSAASLTSPVTHKVPHGTWTATWSRADYFDKSKTWTTDPASDPRTIDLTMTEGALAPEYRVMSDFAYDAATDTFRVNSWLERGGVILTKVSACTIHIFDNTETKIQTLSSAAPDANGIFWQNWPTADLDPDALYFARVDIVFSGQTYSSGRTYNINIPKAIAGLGVGIGEDIHALRVAVGEDLSVQTTDIKTTIDRLEDSIGTDLADQISTVRTDVADVKDEVTGLNDSLGAILESTTEEVRNAQTEAILTGVNAEILNRDLHADVDETVTVRFRTATGLQPTLTVYDGESTVRVQQAGMTEISQTGIYEASFTVSKAWGEGAFTVLCSETTRGVDDSAVLMVDASSPAGLSADLAEVGAAAAEAAQASSELHDALYDAIASAGGDGETSVTLDTTELAASLKEINETLQAGGADGEATAILKSMQGELSGAANDARGAKNQASTAVALADEITSLLQAEGRGATGLSSAVEGIRGDVAQLVGRMDTVSGREQVADIGRRLNEVAAGVADLAKQNGFDVPPAAQLQPSDLEDLKRMQNAVAEIRAMTEHVRLLVDRQTNKPVVKSWMEWK